MAKQKALSLTRPIWGNRWKNCGRRDGRPGIPAAQLATVDLTLKKFAGMVMRTILVRFAQMLDRRSGLERHPASQLAAGWWLTEDMFAWLLGGFSAPPVNPAKISRNRCCCRRIGTQRIAWSERFPRKAFCWGLGLVDRVACCPHRMGRDALCKGAERGTNRRMDVSALRAGIGWTAAQCAKLAGVRGGLQHQANAGERIELLSLRATGKTAPLRTETGPMRRRAEFYRQVGPKTGGTDTCKSASNGCFGFER